MSMRLLNDPQAVHEVRDDIESTIWVLLWAIIKFGPHKMDISHTTAYLDTFSFDDSEIHAHLKKMFVRSGRLSINDFGLCTPALESLICDLVDALARDTRDCSESWLKDHKWIIGRVRSALADEKWMGTKDDGFRVRELSVELVPRSAWRKRKASIEDYWVELEGDRVEMEERRKRRKLEGCDDLEMGGVEGDVSVQEDEDECKFEMNLAEYDLSSG